MGGGGGVRERGRGEGGGGGECPHPTLQSSVRKLLKKNSRPRRVRDVPQTILPLWGTEQRPMKDSSQSYKTSSKQRGANLVGAHGRRAIRVHLHRSSPHSMPLSLGGAATSDELCWPISHGKRYLRELH
jgi:hypothetical protein